VSRRLRRVFATVFVVVATSAAAVGCSSSGSTTTPPPNPGPQGVSPTDQTTSPAGGCGVLSDLMRTEQTAIQDLQAGKISGPAAEATITGVNGQLARAVEAAGRNSILGIALTQLVSENGTMAEALNQSVPVANLGEVIGSINQDVSNVEANCHG